MRQRDGVDRAITVIAFKKEYNPSGFDRPVTHFFQNEIQSRLLLAGIDSLTVIIRRGPHHELLLRLDGCADNIAKAKMVLGPMVENEEALPTSHRTPERLPSASPS